MQIAETRDLLRQVIGENDDKLQKMFTYKIFQVVYLLFFNVVIYIHGDWGNLMTLRMLLLVTIF